MMECNCDKCEGKIREKRRRVDVCKECSTTEELHIYKSWILCHDCLYEIFVNKVDYVGEITSCEVCDETGCDGYTYGAFHYCSIDCIIDECAIVLEY